MSLVRPPRLRPIPVNSLIPNMLTVISLCAGLTSIRFSLAGEWDLAVLAIVLAGILDGLDGRLARMLKGATRFGAELDSLSDFVSFGVSPVVLLYEWTLSDLGGVGWIVVLGYPVCCALRLARFGTDHDGERRPQWAASFFVGVPAPAAAGLALFPLVATFQFGWELFQWPALVAPYVVAISVGMVSRLPTASFKRLRVRREHVLPLLAVVGLAVAALTSYPWLALSAATLAYLVSIPVTVTRYASIARRDSRAAAATAAPAASAARPDTEADGEPPAAPPRKTARPVLKAIQPEPAEAPRSSRRREPGGDARRA